MPPTTLERLRVFHAIAEIGTIAGAARLLDYTPSAVSQQLAALEREAGTALVERSNRGVTLTAAGRLLVRRASDVLDVVRGAFDELGAAAMPISVAAFPTAIVNLLMPLRDRLTPAIRLTLVHAESEVALRAVRARHVDAAVVDGLAGDPYERADDLHRVVLRTEPVRLVARAGDVAPTLADYSEHDWVLGGPSSRLGTAARQACRAAGFVPNVVVESDDHFIAFEFIAATGAVALLPELALGNLPDGLAVAAIEVLIERRIELVTRHPLRDHPAITALTTHLTSKRS